jgi:hypothetical protein
MDIVPIHELYARIMGNTVQHRTNTYLNNGLEPGSPRHPHSDITPCAVLERSHQQHVFVVRLTNYATIFASVVPEEKWYLWRNNGSCSASD